MCVCSRAIHCASCEVVRTRRVPFSTEIIGLTRYPLPVGATSWSRHRTNGLDQEVAPTRRKSTPHR